MCQADEQVPPSAHPSVLPSALASVLPSVLMSVSPSAHSSHHTYDAAEATAPKSHASDAPLAADTPQDTRMCTLRLPSACT